MCTTYLSHEPLTYMYTKHVCTNRPHHMHAYTHIMHLYMITHTGGLSADCANAWDATTPALCQNHTHAHTHTLAHTLIHTHTHTAYIPGPWQSVALGHEAVQCQECHMDLYWCVQFGEIHSCIAGIFKLVSQRRLEYKYTSGLVSN